MRFQKIFRFTLGSRILAIKVNAWNQELHTHYGITNETPDHKFIPFWDFQEDVSLDLISKALRSTQIRYLLDDIFVIQTYPNQSYRAFSFDKISWKEYISLLASTDLIDMSYLKHSVMRGRAVIRITEKDGTENRLVKMLRYPISNYLNPNPTSEHHRAFFSGLNLGIAPRFPIPHPIKVRLSKYESFR